MNSRWCGRRESNPHDCWSRDFKSRATASWLLLAAWATGGPMSFSGSVGVRPSFQAPRGLPRVIDKRGFGASRMGKAETVKKAHLGKTELRLVKRDGRFYDGSTGTGRSRIGFRRSGPVCVPGYEPALPSRKDSIAAPSQGTRCRHFRQGSGTVCARRDEGRSPANAERTKTARQRKMDGGYLSAVPLATRRAHVSLA
jgi:hypothetical protein